LPIEALRFHDVRRLIVRFIPFVMRSGAWLTWVRSALL